MSNEQQPHSPTNTQPLSDFERLAALHGIGGSYNDFRGDLRHISTPSKAAILEAMGIAAADDRAIEAAIGNQETVHWMRMVDGAIVVTMGQPAKIPVSIPLALTAKQIAWSLTLEYGATRGGTMAVSDLKVREHGALDKREFIRAELELPSDLPLGYHHLSVTLDTGLTGESRLIVAPERSFEPESIQRGERAFRTQLGHGRLPRFARSGPVRRAIRLRSDRRESTARTDAGKSQPHQSVQSFEPRILERAVYRDRGRTRIRRLHTLPRDRSKR
jgi:hypothetical protein